mmetsp:Transcript_68752/g.159382  ORF Transcript_68752/g.159382 Transcript_68752/m.159382 type:complete len:208 (-) Transcript_68752:129-752(-)
MHVARRGRGERLAGLVAGLAGWLLVSLGAGRVSFVVPATVQDAAVTSRRLVVLPAAIAAGSALVPEEAFAAVPNRISADPFGLIGVTKPGDKEAIKQEFFLKKDYTKDTSQLLKHMKIAGSLDKGTPNMAKYFQLVREELNDWVATYKRPRDDVEIGRASFQNLALATTKLASHLNAAGSEMPFPAKMQPRYYELIDAAEKLLEKGK